MRIKIRVWLLLSVVIIGIGVFLLPKFTIAKDSLEDIISSVKVYIEALYYVRNAYIEKNLDNKKLEYESIRGMVKALDDPYTEFFDPKSFKTFTEDMQGVFGGVGIRLESKDGKILVVSPIENTPAHRAGIKPGDQIVEVDGQSVINKPLDVVVSLIRGEIGKEVKIKIYRESEKKYYEYTLKRELIEVPVVEYKTLKNNIGYIKFYEFTQNSPQKIIDALKKLEKSSGLILDLRNNPGGDLRSAVMIASMFISDNDQVKTVIKNGETKTFTTKGVVVYRMDRNQNLYGEKVVKGLYRWNKPLVVLVNRYSASASEILSGALKDYGKGILLGEKTFGKGVVQTIFTLSDGSALKLTTEKYLLPSGKDINKEGIQPDVIVEMAPENVGKDNDIQLEKAIEVLLKQLSKLKEKEKLVLNKK
ncbi:MULTISPECIES: S41 family peptidase [Dictyoglomus]|uniref:Carboxyl-terminal protease n=1 Tax=Dictyoglomus turgidum (strain DSM 6724 / Z-1310) TaxID=515635 RepID=B8E2A4_DICTD|nr:MULTISPECIES: S41 family peptidase [Dictyoglomus]ACK42381.1 carboxyl-terminal protease [Dictyoglomus turgidum DSM 6724]PNV80380.1 MAG: S41 family peptidase [Dictyoglomus turgidum]HBU32163.1 S41 family peptidase [Dictyoglomus sp.]